jgi:hypothetical protein
MPRLQHYSHALERFIVSVLYHEARKQNKLITVLANNLPESSLCARKTCARLAAAPRNPVGGIRVCWI